MLQENKYVHTCLYTFWLHSGCADIWPRPCWPTPAFLRSTSLKQYWEYWEIFCQRHWAPSIFLRPGTHLFWSLVLQFFAVCCHPIDAAAFVFPSFSAFRPALLTWGSHSRSAVLPLAINGGNFATCIPGRMQRIDRSNNRWLDSPSTISKSLIAKHVRRSWTFLLRLLAWAGVERLRNAVMDRGSNNKILKSLAGPPVASELVCCNSFIHNSWPQDRGHLQGRSLQKPRHLPHVHQAGTKERKPAAGWGTLLILPADKWSEIFTLQFIKTVWPQWYERYELGTRIKSLTTH